MHGVFGNLRLYAGGDSTADPAAPALPAGPPDPVQLANRELIRPPTFRHGHRRLDPFSPAWFDELEQKRYARHGAWLAAGLEFGRHPGESVLVLNPGLGSDAIRYQLNGSEVTVGTGPGDHPDLIRANFARYGVTPRITPLPDAALPFPAGAFDVVVLNALHTPLGDPGRAVEELYRVLKAGGKLIGLFPAHYNAGFWQDALLPLQHLYWHHPPAPGTAPATTRRGLLRTFARFADHRVAKRHLRRSELPHLCRVFPLPLLERLVGQVLVLKAFKPVSAARTPAATVFDSLAA